MNFSPVDSGLFAIRLRGAWVWLPGKSSLFALAAALHLAGAIPAVPEVPGSAQISFVHSPTDNKAVLAVARHPDETPVPCADALFELDFDSITLRRLLVAKADDRPEADLSCLLDPKYTADGRSIIFTVPAWVTGSALHVLDLQSGKTRFLIDGGPFIVTAEPGLEDRIRVLRHKYTDGADSMAYDEADVVRLSDGAVLESLPKEARQRLNGVDWLVAELTRLHDQGIVAW